MTSVGFLGGSAIKNLWASAGDVGSIPRSGRPPGEGNGNPLQYSCLGNPMNRGSWQATVREVVAKSQIRPSDSLITTIASDQCTSIRKWRDIVNTNDRAFPLPPSHMVPLLRSRAGPGESTTKLPTFQPTPFTT